MTERIAVLTEGLFDDYHAKTAHGVIRYAPREVVAVIDSQLAGKTADEVVPFTLKPVPIVESVAAAAEKGADVLMVGIAPTGGKLDDTYHRLLLEGIERGMHIEAGLHTLLNDDPELRAAAERQGVELRDLRVPPSDLGVNRGPGAPRRDGLKVVHSVGSDCAIGKKVTTLELDRVARERGLRSVYVPTGQTGIAIAGWGIAVDHVLSDYLGGAAERLVNEGAEHGDLLFLEGQGALFHPAYSGVTLGLLHGSLPDALVLAHKAGATAVNGYPDVPLVELPELVHAYEDVMRPLKPARVAAITLNTASMDVTQAAEAIAETEDVTGVVTDDVVRFGSDRVLDAVLATLEHGVPPPPHA